MRHACRGKPGLCPVQVPRAAQRLSAVAGPCEAGAMAGATGAQTACFVDTGVVCRDFVVESARGCHILLNAHRKREEHLGSQQQPPLDPLTHMTAAAGSLRARWQLMLLLLLAALPSRMQCCSTVGKISPSQGGCSCLIDHGYQCLASFVTAFPYARSRTARWLC